MADGLRPFAGHHDAVPHTPSLESFTPSVSSEGQGGPGSPDPPEHPDPASVRGGPSAGQGGVGLQAGPALSAREPLVADPVRLIGRGPELPVPELLVLGEVALEEPDLAVALEREHVGRDPVEEPAVVADHDGAARE